MIDKLEEIDAGANRDSVVKKINNLRSTYNKELKKVQASKTSGSGSDGTYTPKLSYFHLLHFIKDQNVDCEPSFSNMRQNIIGNNEQVGVMLPFIKKSNTYVFHHR